MKTKYLYLFILCCLLTKNFSSAKNISTPYLEKPNYIQEFIDFPEDIKDLARLEEQSRHLDFYERCRYIHLHNNTNIKDLASIQYFFWFNYYLSSASLLAFEDYNSETPPSFTDNTDLQLIRTTYANFLKMARNNLDDLVKDHHLKKQDLTLLFCSYSACLLNKVRQAHIENISKKEQVAKLNYSKKKSANSKISLEEQFINFHNKVILNQNRNEIIRYTIEGMEKDFVPTLVQLFPGKKGEVVKYIRMAGYKDNEINDLVDRTVGRDSQTEFLYKGRSKKDAR